MARERVTPVEDVLSGTQRWHLDASRAACHQAERLPPMIPSQLYHAAISMGQDGLEKMEEPQVMAVTVRHPGTPRRHRYKLWSQGEWRTCPGGDVCKVSDK